MNWDRATPGIHILPAVPNSGKSYAIKWLIYNLWIRNKFTYGVVWSPTAFTGSYDFMPRNVYTLFNVRKTREDKDQPWEHCNDVLDRVIEHKASNPRSRAFIIWDDCLGSVPWNSKQITSIIANHRHHRLTIFIATQYINKISPMIGECAKFVYVFNQVQKKSIKAVHEAYFSVIDEKEFKKWLQKYCKDHHFILVNLYAS